MDLVSEIKLIKEQINQLSNDKDNEIKIDQLQSRLAALLAVYKLQVQAELTRVKLLQTLRTSPNLQ